MIVKDDVIKIVASYMSVPDDEVKNINRETGLFKDMGMNSFELGSVVEEVEQRFDVDIPIDEFEKIATIGDIVSCVERRLQGKGVK